MPPTRCLDWEDLFHAVNQHVANGVVTATNNARERYWREWRKFLRTDFDPHLPEMDPEQKISILQIFAERVRRGNHGRKSQVRAGTVQDALGHVGKTFELDGWPNPLYGCGTRTYHIRIARQLECYSRNDTPSQSQLAVPVSVANKCYSATRNGTAQEKATGELCLIAFFFLLRVGEYTIPHATRTTRTQQFRLRDIAFFNSSGMLTWQEACNSTTTPSIVRLRIDNQKNGKRGQTLVHHATPSNQNCPVKACLNRVRHLIAHHASADTLLCAYKNKQGEPFLHITSTQIVKAVRHAVLITGNFATGFETAKIGSHSLRAGGAMALYLQNYDATTIQKLGRWKSQVFLMYLHEQIGAFTAGVATRMATETTFQNLGA